MKKILKITVLLVTFFLYAASLQAQCAMCRSTLESNVSVGQMEVSSQLNFGILYLLLAPYFLLSLVAFFWYKNSKSNKSGKMASVVSDNN